MDSKSYPTGEYKVMTSSGGVRKDAIFNIYEIRSGCADGIIEGRAEQGWITIMGEANGKRYAKNLAFAAREKAMATPASSAEVQKMPLHRMEPTR